jgi:hypothetical protein
LKRRTCSFSRTVGGFPETAVLKQKLKQKLKTKKMDSFKFEIETYKYAGTLATGYHDLIWGLSISETGEACVVDAEKDFPHAHKKQAHGVMSVESSVDFAWTIAYSTNRPQVRTLGSTSFEAIEPGIRIMRNLKYAADVRAFLKARGWTYDGSGGWVNPSYVEAAPAPTPVETVEVVSVAAGFDAVVDTETGEVLGTVDTETGEVLAETIAVTPEPKRRGRPRKEAAAPKPVETVTVTGAEFYALVEATPPVAQNSPEVGSVPFWFHFPNGAKVRQHLTNELPSAACVRLNASDWTYDVPYTTLPPFAVMKPSDTSSSGWVQVYADFTAYQAQLDAAGAALDRLDAALQYIMALGEVPPMSVYFGWDMGKRFLLCASEMAHKVALHVRSREYRCWRVGEADERTVLSAMDAARRELAAWRQEVTQAAKPPINAQPIDVPSFTLLCGADAPTLLAAMRQVTALRCAFLNALEAARTVYWQTTAQPVGEGTEAISFSWCVEKQAMVVNCARSIGYFGNAVASGYSNEWNTRHLFNSIAQGLVRRYLELTIQGDFRLLPLEAAQAQMEQLTA